MPTEQRVLNDFAGRWTVDREIIPLRGAPGRFSGRAIWHPDGDGLLYEEQGTLVLDGQPPMAAHRRYHWHPDLWITFEDGRRFHQVPACGGTSTHWCDPDSYEACYDFTGWPGFRVTWQVSGSRKDYRMISRYLRA